MFKGFTDETVQFFLDLKFHNSTSYFHEQHDRYIEYVQKPFYELISELAADMKNIDPRMETRPYKALSRIHRDTRFTRDKSPYRDHLWFLFRREAEPREKSLMFFFEFGPTRLNWGMGYWGENRVALDLFRKHLQANINKCQMLVNSIDMERRGMTVGGTVYKRISIPEEIPVDLRRWYCAKEFYIIKNNPDYQSAFTEKVLADVRSDFIALGPLYRTLRKCSDEINSTGIYVT